MEYIEREALLLRIDCHGTNKFGMLDEDIRAFVKAQPAADVVPVVRCKDCKHCGFCGKSTNLEVMGFYGFCSRGEKQEDER